MASFFSVYEKFLKYTFPIWFLPMIFYRLLIKDKKD